MKRLWPLCASSGLGLLLIACLCLPFAVGVCPAASAGTKTIRIGGTGAALGTMKLLAGQFKKKRPDVNIIIYPSLGSSGGIKALLGGDIDIALANKMPSAAEQREELKGIEYGKTPFVFVAHKENRLSGITLRQAADIYAGRNITWPDGTTIRLILRPAAESSIKMLQGMSGEMNAAVVVALTREGMNIAINDQENADMLERLPGSFGAASLCQLISEKRGLRIFSLDGVTPGVKTLSDGTYPFFNSLYMVTGPRSSPLARQFTDFVFSLSGQSILIKTGHLATGQQR
ncbi:MAG: substrate-binding domain-containing protein [Nitrospirae bacterium]|nr:substrate-binding domain-containing protein [Nitrospirota bacterium]